MSNYMQKGKSSNSASANGAFANFTMRTPALTRTRSIIPNAPFKAPRPFHRGVEQGELNDFNVPITGLELRRTNSAFPGSGQVGGFIMGPQAGAMLGIDNSIQLPPKKDMTRVVSPSTERMRRSPTPVLGESGELFRSRSPTLSNINEALSPRTDLAVSGLKSLSQENTYTVNTWNGKWVGTTDCNGKLTLSQEHAVLNATDSEGNVDVAALNANTILNATKENARAKYLQALKDLNDAAENCLNIEGANWPSYFHTHLKEVSVLHEYMEFKGNGVEEPVEEPVEPKRQCTGCLTGQANQMAHSCLGFASAENSQEEIEPLNRSFAPEPPLQMPKVGAIYVRKARDGPQYAWVEHKTSRTLRNEFMKQGHRVEVVHLFPDDMWPKLYFRSLDGGILTLDMHQSDGYFGDYYVNVEDFYKHMELVTEEAALQKPTSSVEQKSGGSMSEEQSRSKLASMDALKRAQANAKDSNDVPISDKKRKAVENPEEDKCSTPTKQIKLCNSVKSPTKYWKSVEQIQQQEAIMLQIEKQVHGKRRSVRLPRSITYDGTNTRHAVEGVNRNGITSPLRSPSNLSRSISWQNNEDIKTLRELECIG